jgi:hypothetical protein
VQLAQKPLQIFKQRLPALQLMHNYKQQKMRARAQTLQQMQQQRLQSQRSQSQLNLQSQ